MSFGRYLAGIVPLALTVAPLAFAGVRLRRRLLPRWDGAAAWLAATVLSLALLLLVAHVLGALGLFRAWALLAAALACGAAATRVKAGAPGAGARRAARRPGKAGLALTAVAIALVAGQWMPDTVDAFDRGMYGSDTLRYHGPVAARFVQEHGITQLHFILDDPTLAFFPYDSELLHAVGILFMGTDVLSPLVNLAWLALALLAAWCCGRPFGLGPATVLIVAPVLVSPTLAQTQPGSGDTDVAALALLLAAVALLLTAEWERPGVAVAGLAVGMAVGVKLTVFGMAGALTAAVALAAPARRRGELSAAWVAGLLVGGSFWFLRNLFAVGNPFPWWDLGPLPSPPFLRNPSVAHYLTDSHIWRSVYFPGLHESYGSVWIAVVVLSLAGMALALAVRGAPLVRMLGGVGAVGVAAYVLAPNTAAGPEGFPIFFSATARYAAPALALGLVMLPLVPRLRPLFARSWVLGALLVLLAATLTNQGIEPLDTPRALTVAAVLLAAAALAAARDPGWRRPLTAAAALLAVVAVAGGAWVADGMVDHRYAEGSLAYAREFHDSRIAVVGTSIQYHLYGTDLSNHVQYAGRRGPHGAFTTIRTCPQWRRALNEGGYRYVVITPGNELFGSFGRTPARQLPWTRGAPGAAEVLHRPDGVRVFRLDGRLPERCVS